MDDQNNNVILTLNPNTDYLEGLPNQDGVVRETAITGGGQEKQSIPQVTESKIDPKEQTFLRLRGEVESFLGSAENRGRRLLDEMDEVRSARGPLTQMAENGTQVSGALAQEPRQDYEIDAMGNEISKMRKRINSEIEDTQRNFSPDSDTSKFPQELVDAKRKLLDSGEFDSLMQELKDADQEQDLVKREERINELRLRLVQQISEIDEKANTLYIENITVSENSKENLTGVNFGLRYAGEVVHYLREKLGESSYYNIQQKLGDMLDGQGQVMRRMKPMEMIPIELKLISQEAYNLGVTVNDIFIAIIKNPK